MSGEDFSIYESILTNISQFSSVILGILLVASSFALERFVSHVEALEARIYETTLHAFSLKSEAAIISHLVYIIDQLLENDYHKLRKQGPAGRGFLLLTSLMALIGFIIPIVVQFFYKSHLYKSPLIYIFILLQTLLAIACILTILNMLKPGKMFSRSIRSVDEVLSHYLQLCEMLILDRISPLILDRNQAIEKASELINKALSSSSIFIFTREYSWIPDCRFKNALIEAKNRGINAKVFSPEPKVTEIKAREGWKEHILILGHENWLNINTTPLRGLLVDKNILLGLNVHTGGYAFLPENHSLVKIFVDHLISYTEKLIHN